MFCFKKELDEIRKESNSFHYPGIWRDRDIGDINNEIKKGSPFTVRLKTPQDGKTSFEDLIYGNISVENNEIDDFIIARSDGSPVYNLTNVVDDSLMKSLMSFEERTMSLILQSRYLSIMLWDLRCQYLPTYQ